MVKRIFKKFFILYYLFDFRLILFNYSFICLISKYSYKNSFTRICFFLCATPLPPSPSSPPAPVFNLFSGSL